MDRRKFMILSTGAAISVALVPGKLRSQEPEQPAGVLNAERQRPPLETPESVSESPVVAVSDARSCTRAGFQLMSVKGKPQ